MAGVGSPHIGPKAWGTARLEQGMVIVEEASVGADSLIFLTVQRGGLGGAVAMPYVSAKFPGSGFVISSLSDRDTSVVAWLVIG